MHYLHVPGNDVFIYIYLFLCVYLQQACGSVYRYKVARLKVDTETLHVNTHMGRRQACFEKALWY